MSLTSIADFVRKYAAADVSRLHMPGHKGRGPLGCEALDLTEIAGADELYEAGGIIAASEENTARLFGTAATYYGAEGSSQCIRAMLFLALQAAPAGQGRPVLLAARNAHKALLYAAALLDVDVEWLWPDSDGQGSLCACPVAPAQLAAALDRFAKLAVGKVAPDFAATRPNGDTFSLYGVPAKYKLLVFWASDDAASRQANPSLIRLYQQFRPRGLEIVGISLDGDLMAWRRAIEQDGISIWTNGSDLEGRSSGIASLYMVGASLPYTVLIGEENKIVAKGLLGDDLTRQLNELTKKKKK